ncbi:hypothetical protein [Streptomyces sp. NPDC001020]
MAVVGIQPGSATADAQREAYAGLPVLGGDLVVHQKKNGARSTTKATDAPISVPGTTPAIAAATAGKSAVASSAAKSAKADDVRKVIWAATGKPVLAWETVLTGTQADGTPSRRHVITDADNGKELFSYEAIETGVGNTMYSGQVTLGTSPSYTLTDTSRGGSKTYDLNGGTSGTGTLFTNATDIWGNGLPSHRETAAADAHYAAAVTWDFYKNELGRNGMRGNGVAANSRVHYGNGYANAIGDVHEVGRGGAVAGLAQSSGRLASGWWSQRFTVSPTLSSLSAGPLMWAGTMRSSCSRASRAGGTAWEHCGHLLGVGGVVQHDQHAPSLDQAPVGPDLRLYVQRDEATPRAARKARTATAGATGGSPDGSKPRRSTYN